MNDKHTVTPENAAKFAEWIDFRGGVAIWNSINLSNPGASWSTPALNLDGSPTQKPTWQAANTPHRVITDAADIVVEEPKEVKRFRVAIRFGANSMSLKVTDAGSRRIRREIEKAGEGAWQVFDYETQEAVILVPAKTTPLPEFIAQQKGQGNGSLA